MKSDLDNKCACYRRILQKPFKNKRNKKFIDTDNQKEIRMKKITTVLIVAGVLMLSALIAAYAAYPSLGSGYAVDSNFHGINVPQGSNVIVTAYTTNMDVYQVTFLWKYPNETISFGPEVDNTPVAGELYEGKPVNTFSSTHSVDVVGDWGVQALFQGSGGTTREDIELVLKIKATSFFVVPVIPVLGTVGSLAAMLLVLGIYIKRKKVA